MTDQNGILRKWRSGILAASVVALVPALLYANTLANSFQYDDTFFILNNRYVHNLSEVGHFFVSPRLISNIPLSGYRPLTMATFALNYAASGDNAMGYHLVNVVIHVLNVLLVYAVSLSLMRTFEIPRGRDAALVIALLFASHPISSQPVNYISGRSTLLVGGFSLLCFLLYARGRQATVTLRARILLIGSIAAYVCALLSKEEAVAVPGLLVLYELCRLRLTIDKKKIWQAFLALLPFLALTLGFIVFVVRIMGIVGDTMPARGVSENLMTQARVLFLYMKLIALPTNLSIDHAVATSTSLFEPVAMASVLGVIGMLAGSIFLVRSAPVVPFGIWWLVIVLVPSSTLVALKLVLNEQRLYLAAIGVVFIMGAGFGKTLEHANSSGRVGLRRTLICGFIAVLVILAALTVRRNTQWRDPTSLWTSTLEEYPNSARANMQIATILLRKNRLEEALEPARKAAEVAPDVVETRVVLADVYSRLGLQEDALVEARAAVDLNPGWPDAQIILGSVYARLGRYKEAEAAWRRTLELVPDNVETRENLEKLKALRQDGNASGE